MASIEDITRVLEATNSRLRSDLTADIMEKVTGLLNTAIASRLKAHEEKILSELNKLLERRAALELKSSDTHAPASPHRLLL